MIQPNISPVSNATTFYNTTESTATANVPTDSNRTKPTTKISPVSLKQAQPISVTNLEQQILSHYLLKQVALMNKQSLIRANANTDT